MIASNYQLMKSPASDLLPFILARLLFPLFQEHRLIRLQAFPAMVIFPRFLFHVQ